MSDPGPGEDDTTDGVDERGTASEGGADGAEPNGGAAGDEPTAGSVGTDRAGGQPGTATASDPKPETPGEWVRWFFKTDHGAVVYLREVLSSVGLVVLVGVLLFAVSGLWPPMVAVESGSMNPHMERGDLVFVMEEGRLVPDAAYGDTGVVTARTGERTGYAKFQQPGDVIVYQPDGNARTTPIIHRAHFWVNESENWVANGKANTAYLGGANSCGELRSCPARSSGFVTKGDANSRYDQVSGLSAPVQPSWVVGTAQFRIPWLGNIRLLAGQSAVEPSAVSAGAEVATMTTNTAANATAAAP
jgi:signal peptidase